MNSKKVILPEKEMPGKWFNIASEFTEPMAPPVNPETGKPAGPGDLAPIFPMAILLQEVSQESFIEIPEDVLNIYRMWRPTPLVRAKNLEEALDTPAQIYFKNEGVSPTGSHKPNTSVPQAFFCKKEGFRRLTTETGAGQWGSSLAFACNFFNLECKVYMVKVSYNQKPYRRTLIETWGGTVIPSPSSETNTGREILKNDPDSPGSLGMAISEAVEDALSRDDTKYSLGSVLNHVLLHQTIIGQEAIKQFEKIDIYPDIIIGCCGGGSNLAGISFPFLRDKIRGIKDPRVIAVEPSACPTLTKGEFMYDYGDSAKLTPLMPMHTLGHNFVPPQIHSGGLRYHGVAPIISKLYNEKLIEARSYNQLECFEAGMTFARAEGIVPAPESTHAVKCAIDEAIAAKEKNEKSVILFNLSGHGHFDMQSYADFLAGKLSDFEVTDKMIDESLKKLRNTKTV